MITTVCKISYGSQTVPPIVPAVQGDTGRAISFEIADFTPPAGATATYFILKPSGEAIYNSATITNNSILCELTAQSLAEAGENRMQVRVLQGEDIVTSFEVILMVRTFLGDDAIESGTEMNIFDQAVEQAAEEFQTQAEQIVEEVIESIPEDYTELTEEVDELNERLDTYIDTTNSNLLNGKTPITSWFIDADTGEGRTLAGFYSYTEIDVSEYVGMTLYPRSNDSAVNYTSRSIVFYQSDGTTRTCGSGNSQAIHDNGINVPANTKYMSVTFRNAASESYVGATPTETEYYALNQSVSVDYSQIKNVNPVANNKRFPAICFEFDDGNAKDADIVNIFKAKGLTCGFALIATGTHSNWLDYQSDGFEILSHSTDGTGMDDASVSISTIETKLKNSLLNLENEGFKVKGFVTPNSTMNRKFKPLLRKYYQFAETEYLGEYTGTQTPYRTPVDGVYNGFRVSLQSTTLANQKDAVDECIANYGCLTFYGHSANLDGTDNLTTDNLNSLLDYIIGKVSNGECVVGNPSDIITTYFNVRNDDISDGWIEVTKEEAELNTEKYTANNWYMAYNKKLKLLYFMVRITPKEDITGQINPLFKVPVQTFNDLVMSETGRNCLLYSGGLLIQGNNTWATGDSKRFSLMAKIR